MQISVSSKANTQQQYQLHSNFVKRGRSGYVHESESNTYRGPQYVRRIQENAVTSVDSAQQNMPYTQQNPVVPQQSPIVQQQIPQQQMMQQPQIRQQPQMQHQPLPSGGYNSYTGYPHYNANAELKRFSAPDSNFKKYYALNFGSAFSSGYNYHQTGASGSFSNNNIIPIINKQGLAGLYVGAKIPSALGVSFRFEYGGQWELLSFSEETRTYVRSIYQHNIAGSVRGFVDLPVSSRFDLTAGFDFNYGLLSNIIAQDQVFTTGMSYGVMAGTVMKISRSRSVFFLLRHGVIPNKNYKIMNTVRSSDFSSTSVIVGLQLASW